MKKIITYGTFDLFHVGHLELLRRAKMLGDHLTVAVSTDEFTAQKGKRCVYTFEDRARIVESIRYVDAVIPETCWEQKREDVEALGISVFVMGDDWLGRFDAELGDLCAVVYLARTDGVSTTKIKRDLKHNIYIVEN